MKGFLRMMKLSFNFDRNWIKENRPIYGNPIRELEKFIKTQELKFVKSDTTSITIELDENSCKEKVDKIIGYIKEQYKLENAWNDIQIGGDINSELADFINGKKEIELKFEEKAVESVVDIPNEKSVGNKTEEKIETKIEEKVEESVVEKTANIPVVCYSPEVKTYLKELDTYIPMLKKMTAYECVWTQNLLIAMDEGYGYSDFLKEIANVFATHGFADKMEKDSWVKEMVVEQKPAAEQKYADWDQVLSYAKSCEKYNQGMKKKRVILSLDISEWQDELNTEKIRKYIRELAKCTINMLCVFRVPFMEYSVLQKLGAVLSDSMTIKLLPVSTISIENMVAYIKDSLKSMQCLLEDGCEADLEQLILNEKQDDSFYGYTTLDKLAREIVYKKAILNCADGVATSIITKENLKTILEQNEEQKDENPYDLLNKLIGMARVKEQIKETVVQIQTYQEMKKEGAKVDRPCIHMMFTGNPGTGKTTVARLIARIMKEEGILRKGHFYEVQARSLCGRYVGETAPRTNAICRDAYGSVLFIDEAYSLARRDNDRDYGKEAIQTLIAEMENHRDDLCVILAGYKKPMEELLELNHGLKSRIPYEIEFPNYSTEELTQIFMMMVEGKFAYEEGLKDVVQSFFANIPEEVMESEEFSNARLVRNMFERTWGKAAYRRSIKGEAQLELKKEDFLCASEMAEFKSLMKDKEKKRIGFSCE